MTYKVNGREVTREEFLMASKGIIPGKPPSVIGTNGGQQSIRYENESDRKQQRTIEQTIREDGGIKSVVDDKVYTSERSYKQRGRIFESKRRALVRLWGQDPANTVCKASR